MITSCWGKTFLLASLMTFCASSIAQVESSDTTIDGLQLLEDTKLALVYAEPGINFDQYNKIYLDDAYIAFKKNWPHKQNTSHANKISHEDMIRIMSDLSTLFREVFSKTLLEGGYELVTEFDEDVLLIKPAIINLDFSAPNTLATGNSLSFSETAGELTLYMELYDSVTNDLIAKALDRQLDRRTGFFQWQNHVSNRVAANRILQVWADVLKEGLDDARAAN